MLWALLGYLGAHRFYLRDWGWGVLYLCTGGLLSVGVLVDAFLLPGKVDACNREIDRLMPARLIVKAPARRLSGP